MDKMGSVPQEALQNTYRLYLEALSPRDAINSSVALPGFWCHNRHRHWQACDRRLT